MATKKKVGMKVPTSNELLKKYGSMIKMASETKESGLWLPSTFFALNYTMGGGIPFGKSIEVAGEASAGKAITMDELILTPEGYKMMRDITLKDQVMDPVTGDPISILGIYPQGQKPIYRITFRDGTYAECSEDHLWEVRFRSHSEWKYEVLSIKEILRRGYIRRDGGYKYTIPSTNPVNFSKKGLPIHPYIMGYILGDGSFNRSNYIILDVGIEDAESLRKNIQQFLKEGAELVDKGVYENPFGKSHRFILKGYGEEIKNLGLEGILSSSKFIPEDYLWSDVEDRKYLLAGLLDSDGTIGNIGHNRAKYSSRFRFSSTSEKLIYQLIHLVRSLGGFITEPKFRERERQFRGYNPRISHEIRTGGRLSFNPFLLQRKHEQYQIRVDSASQSMGYGKAIVNIEYVGMKECQCIKVDSDRGLFMIHDFIVTHNTLIAYNFAYACQQLGGKVIWVDAEQSWMNSWAEANGVDPSGVTVITDTRIEYVSDAIADIALYLRSQLTHNEPILLVIDSIAAMDCADNIDSKMADGKAEMGGRAKALYKYFRIRSELLGKLGVCQIYINQLRTALNVGFGKDNSCLHYDTMIPFVDGTSMKIGDIIKNHISKEVWSYNEITRQFEPKPITGWVVKEETEDWYQFKTTGPETTNGFNGFTCTGTHHCLTNNGWKKAQDITLKDKLITKQRRVVNGTLKDFLWGTLIGDASLYSSKGKDTTRLTFSNSKQLEYLNWKVQKISKAFPMKAKNSHKYITTKGYTELEEIRKQIKVDKRGRGQRNPLKLWVNEKISDLTLALWYMDDGHKYNDTTVGISISPNRVDLKKLSEYLTEQGLDNYYPGTTNSIVSGIKFTPSGSKELMRRIARYIIPSMRYKILPGKWDKYQDFELSFEEFYIPKEVDILSISHEYDSHNRRFKRPYKRRKYDITIPDNHNFLAGSVEQGVVVHNTTTGGAALGFYASIRLAFYAGKTITVKVKGKERKAGKNVTIRVLKNKVAPPRPTISKCPVYFNPKFHEVGFDRYFGLEDVLVENDILEKNSGGTYKYRGATLCRGEEKFIKLMEEDAELRRKLLRAAEINTIGTTKKKIAKWGDTNLFPVDDNLDYESQQEDDEDYEEEEG